MVMSMTLLMDHGDAVVVRCDACRRLWPITRQRMRATNWSEDGDRHVCPICNEAAAAARVSAEGADAAAA
jgi:hypothetical protein